jgi:hypothetical protein
MPVGPGVDHVEHGSRGLRRHEAQHLLQDRLDAGEAADIVWATNAAEMYQLLVGQQLEPAALRALPRRYLAAPAPGRPVRIG